MNTSNPNHPLPPETVLEMNKALYSFMTLVTSENGPIGTRLLCRPFQHP